MSWPWVVVYVIWLAVCMGAFAWDPCREWGLALGLTIFLGILLLMGGAL